MSLRAPTFRAGAFCFADSDNADAIVLWCPEQCPLVLPVTAQDVSKRLHSPVDLARLPCLIVLHRSDDGRQHVLLRKGDRDLQLCATGADISSPVVLHVDAIWPACRVAHSLQALDCLNALHATGQMPPRLFPPEPRGARLRFVIQALDGSLAGASHRQIATALFGSARVRSDWSDPGDHLRDRVRRAIRRGRALMNGGYRDFLV